MVELLHTFRQLSAKISGTIMGVQEGFECAGPVQVRRPGPNRWKQDAIHIVAVFVTTSLLLTQPVGGDLVEGRALSYSIAAAMLLYAGAKIGIYFPLRKRPPLWLTLDAIPPARNDFS